MHPIPHHPFRRRAMALLSALLLSACGGGGGGNAPAAPPATHAVSVRIDSAVAAGESFSFSLGAQTLNVTASGTPVAFAQALAEGTAFTVNQTVGPRTCTLSANRTGTMASADVLVTATCGTSASTSRAAGELRGPVGAQVTLRLNGGDDTVVTVAPLTGSIDNYNVQAFSFPTALTDGTVYTASIATSPANQTCTVYKGASGTMPVATGALKVGCEYTYDHVSRSTDNSVKATRVEAFLPAIGGSDTALGATTQGYGEGRFVAFVSSATGLSPNGQRQVFWRDRLTGETFLISTDAAGVPGNGASDRPAISADGLTVVFESAATNLVANDSNGVTDIFVWSAAGGSLPTGVQRVSVGPAGLQANGASNWAVVNGDGTVVAFASNASNLAATGTGTSGVNVYRRKLSDALNTLVSVNASGVGTGGDAPAISEDGNRIAFWSFSSQIVAGDTNGLWDIFVYQHDTGTRRRVSLRADGGERNQGTDSASRLVWPAISGNGRFVAYATTSTNVVAGDTNATQDIFVVDLDGSLGVRRASMGPAGAQGNGDSPVGQGERVALSFDGSWMAFTSSATNFGTTASSGPNVFLRNLNTGEIRVITDASFGADIPTMSHNAAYLAFGAGAQLDSRFASTGLFAHFTGISRSWWWID
jgi:Tol biopolymer transport system component